MAIDGVEDSARELLSALADGEVDSAGVAPSCGAWARSDRLRADWHAWHLIGDVLRSDDLAADPRRDRHFCAAVRMRLAAEPVVLAPAPVAPSAVLARGSRRGPWAAAGAVAAGLVLVVGTFVVVRPVDAPLPPRLAHRRRTADRRPVFGDPSRSGGRAGGDRRRQQDHSRRAARSLPRGPQAIRRHLGAGRAVGIPAQRDRRFRLALIDVSPCSFAPLPS